MVGSLSKTAFEDFSARVIGRGIPLAAFFIVALLVLELLLISIAYNHSFEFECRAQAPAFFCAFLSLGVVRAICIAGALLVFFMARGPVLRRFAGSIRDHLEWPWIGLQLVGIILIFLPWTFLADDVSRTGFAFGAALWVLGAICAVLGGALALVSGEGWRTLLESAGAPIAAIVVVAGLAPEVAAMFQHVWKFDPLTTATFNSTQLFLEALGYTVTSHPPTHLLGIEEFEVLVGRQCSGVEGFLLITAFLAFYIWLFRHDLKFPRIWILLPIGLIFSWIFNVFRISMLIMLGHHVSPDLAINGFHSHAGWLMFTIVAVGLSYTAHRIMWFRKDGKAQAAKRVAVPLADDPYAALILPFVVFMATALLFSTFTEIPGLYYWIRFLCMAAILIFFHRYLRSLSWSPDPLALASGAFIGVLWLATAQAADDTDSALANALADLSVVGFVLWVTTRALGSALLVPVIEELFFRGYVLKRIDTGGMAMRILALAVSSGLFAALHDRWIAAFLAGLIFGLLFLRRGRVEDAIWSHIIANAVIVFWAIVTLNWSVI